MGTAKPAASASPRTGPSAPTGGRVGPGFIASLTGAFFGAWLALLPATQVTLALRVQQIAPAGKAATLSLVLGVGATVSLLAQNVFGALSDRTTSRFGRRKPWIAAGAVLGLASLGLLATAPSVPLLALAWALTQLTFNILLAGLNPVLPDQVPAEQLGRVSAIAGFTQQVGIVGGAYLAQLFLPNLNLAILLPGVLCLASSAVFLLVLRDRRLSETDRRPFNLRTLVGAYWVNPREHPDFGWAWLSRFLVFFGNFAFTSYQTYFLMDRFGFSAKTVATVVFQALLIHTGCVVAASVGFGAVSDRIRRRKLFVLLSGGILALAHVLAAFSYHLPLFLLASAVAGLAFGCYLSVDLALTTEVLPSPADAGKDMAVLHLANVLPQTLAPATAPLFLAIGTGENYPALFLAGAVAGLAGAFCIQRVRTVR